MRRSERAWLGFGLLVCVPLLAQANSGTALMLTGYLHMLLGNAFIGVFEGLVLTKVYKVRGTRAVTRMVLANYFSAWVGVLILVAVGKTFPYDLSHWTPWFWSMATVLFVATLVLEYPFVRASLSDNENPWRKALKGSLLVQSLSYVFLFLVFGGPQAAGFLDELDVVDVEQMRLPAGVRLYYVSPEDHAIYTGLVDERKWTHEFEGEGLEYRESVSKSESWDIVVTSDDGEDVVLVQEALSLQDFVASEGEAGSETSARPLLHFGFARRFGSARDSLWTFWRPFWGGHGMEGKNKDTGETLRVPAEAPYEFWGRNEVYHLPGNILLFRFGASRICVYDIERNQLAELVRGTHPVILLEKPDAISPANTTNSPETHEPAYP